MNVLRKVIVNEKLGFFHGFYTFAENDGSSCAMAVIEFSDNGMCDWFMPDRVKFVEPPAPPNSEEMERNDSAKLKPVEPGASAVAGTQQLKDSISLQKQAIATILLSSVLFDGQSDVLQMLNDSVAKLESF